MLNARPAAPLAPIVFEFQSYKAMEFEEGHPLIFFAFEGQSDPAISKGFPEVEDMREHIEKRREVVDDMTHYFTLVRDGKKIPSILVYLGQPWKRRRRHYKSHLAIGSINFYEIVQVQMRNAVKKLRDMEFIEATIILPSRFYPKNLKKDERGEREEEIFAQKLVEAIVIENTPSSPHLSSQKPRIGNICFTHFGDHEQTATHFFNRAERNGVQIGEAVLEARRLTLLPPNEKFPLRLAELILGARLSPRSTNSPAWRSVKKHGLGPNVKATLVYGAEGLRKAGFGGISLVGRGSNYEPCFLKLHYRPREKKEGVRTLSLIGKGITFDSGGMNVKGDSDDMERMHYDMAGAATVASVFRLAVKRELLLELVALLPLAENMTGVNPMRMHEVGTHYDGQPAEITHTDSEGRLVLADAVAYSEKHVRPDVTVTAATLCGTAEYGPDFMQGLTNSMDLERRAVLARDRSHEKIVFLPPVEHFNGVDELLVGDGSDLKNEPGYHSQTAGSIYVSNFLQRDPSPWFDIQLAAIMEKDADDYGAGPGFGVRFLWQFVKQFAR